MDKIKKYFAENKIEISFVCILTLIAFIVRIIAINNMGDLIHDELYSWYFASKKNVFELISSVLKEDIHMPLYFIILHFWIKIFGNSVKSMHICTLVSALPLIPLSFYIMKILFNKTAAYYAAALLALNTFCIYYSQQIRYYGLILTLSILLAFVFAKLMEKFKLKYIIAYIIVHTLLLYSFSLSVILLMFYAIIGFSYILIKKRNIKEFVATYCVIILLSLPAIIFTIKNHFDLSSNICLHSAEFFNFSWWAVYDILENFFSNENYQLYARAYGVYRDLSDNIINIKYFILVFIPVVISIFGLVKGAFSKNIRLTLFFLPSLLSLIYIVLLASADALYFQTKYLTLVFPVFVCCCAFGLSLIRNKIASVVLFSIMVYLNIMHIALSPNNILNYQAVEMDNLKNVANNVIEVRENDLLFIPFIGDKLKLYIDKGELIPFSFDEALLLKNKEPLKIYFGDKLYKKIDSNNAKDIMAQYIFENKIPTAFEDNMKTYFKNMQKGQRFIYISPYEKVTGVLDEPWGLNSDNYQYISKFAIIMSKVTRDAKKLTDDNLKFKQKYKDPKREYSIYVYEK